MEVKERSGVVQENASKFKDPTGLIGGADLADQRAQNAALEQGNFSEPVSLSQAFLRPTVAMDLTSTLPFAGTQTCVDLQRPMAVDGQEPSSPHFSVNNRQLSLTPRRLRISKLRLLLILPKSPGRRVPCIAREPMEKGKPTYLWMS